MPGTRLLSDHYHNSFPPQLIISLSKFIKEQDLFAQHTINWNTEQNTLRKKIKVHFESETAT